MQNNSDNHSYQRKGHKILIIAVVVTAIVLSFVGGYFFHYLIDGKKANLTSQIVSIMDKAGYIYDPVTGEKRDITEEDIADALVNAFLDEYSAYYTKEEYDIVTAESMGNRAGAGIVFHTEKPILTRVLGNSPAYKAGLRAGDKVVSVSVDGQTTDVQTSTEIIEFLLDKDASKKITFNAQRKGESISVSFYLAEYVTSYVIYYDDSTCLTFESQDGGDLTEKMRDDEKMTSLPSDVALIVFHSFEGDASEQLKKALSFMKAQGKSKLILDLRYNGGGYMDVLSEVCSLLIYNSGLSKFPIAYSDGKTGQTVFKSSANKFFGNIKSISVIANEYSASATECLIGAMLYYGEHFNMDKLVIEKNADGVAKTYGKGIMQTTYGLMDGGAFKLTTAQILWPDAKTCIHKKGIIQNGENAVTADLAIARAIAVLN